MVDHVVETSVCLYALLENKTDTLKGSKLLQHILGIFQLWSSCYSSLQHSTVNSKFSPVQYMFTGQRPVDFIRFIELVSVSTAAQYGHWAYFHFLSLACCEPIKDMRFYPCCHEGGLSTVCHALQYASSVSQMSAESSVWLVGDLSNGYRGVLIKIYKGRALQVICLWEHGWFTLMKFFKMSPIPWNLLLLNIM